METFYSGFAIFVTQPLLALVPAVVFLILARLRRSRFAFVTALSGLLIRFMKPACMLASFAPASAIFESISCSSILSWRC